MSSHSDGPAILQSNYETPRTRVPALIAVTCTFTALILPFLGMRLFVRARLKRLRADDAIIIAAAVRLWLTVPIYNLEADLH